MSALEDYKQLLDAYPNANKFISSLIGNVQKNVPTQADFQSPEAMSQWSQSAALNAPMGLMFAGKMAANAPIEKFNQAADLAQKYGIESMPVGSNKWMNTNEDIWKQTGIHYGYDMKPRFEISDLGAKFSTPDDYATMLRDRQDSIENLKNAAQQIREEKKNLSGQVDLFPKDLKTAQNAELQNIKNQIAANKEDISGDYGLEWAQSGANDVKAKFALQHPELNATYPELMDKLRVRFSPPNMAYRGSYQNGLVNIYGRQIPQIESTGLHEIQHAIQELEGLNRGGNTEAAPWIKYKIADRAYREIPESTKNKATEATSLMQSVSPLRQVSYIHDLENIKRPRDLFNTTTWMQNSSFVRDLIGPPPKSGSRLPYAQKAGEILAKQELLKLPSSAFELYHSGISRDEVKRQIRNIDSQLNRRWDAWRETEQKRKEVVNSDPRMNTFTEEDKYNMYKNLAGEAEARATQARENLTPSQRANRFPLLDYDIQNPIVHFDTEYAKGGLVSQLETLYNKYGIGE